jgi:hypothetical protein
MAAEIQRLRDELADADGVIDGLRDQVSDLGTALSDAEDEVRRLREVVTGLTAERGETPLSSPAPAGHTAPCAGNHPPDAPCSVPPWPGFLDTVTAASYWRTRASMTKSRPHGSPEQASTTTAATRHDRRTLIRCRWCGKDRRRPSDWEQQNLSGDWQRLCARCASRRLASPWSALLTMRRVTPGATP